MRHRSRPLLLSLSLASLRCGSDSPAAPVPPPTAPPFVLTVPQLTSPAPNAMISQSDPATGCPFSIIDSYGTQIDFAWTASQSSAGLAGYDIYVKGPGAIYPIVNARVAAPSYRYRSCNGHVVDAFLNNWEWKVRAVDVQGNLSAWSPSRTFNFEPCRLNRRARCTP